MAIFHCYVSSPEGNPDVPGDQSAQHQQSPPLVPRTQAPASAWSSADQKQPDADLLQLGSVSKPIVPL